MILNVDPGGWGADTASPARRLDRAVPWRITATSPSCWPSAAAACPISPGLIVVGSERPRTKGACAITRVPNSSRSEGWPPSRRS
jgi:hypothetical protein